jgi:hypothetical protein
VTPIVRANLKVIQQERDVLGHAIHRGYFVRRIAFAETSEVRRDNAIRSTQRGDLFVPQ